MKRTLTALLACLLCVGTVLVAAPASASGTDNPVILSPTDGMTTPVGWNGPVSIDFSNSPAGRWYIDLLDTDNDGNEVTHTSVVVNEGDGIKSVPLTGVKPGHLQLLVQYGEASDVGYGSSALFTVPVPPMTLSAVSVSPTTFYPRVHDGYRDTTTLAYTLKHPYRTPHVAAKVTNRAGATIRSATLAASARSWAWGGRKNDGTLAPTGDYKITLTASDPGTPTLRASKWATIATGHRYRTTTKTLDGDNGARATSGDCTAMRDTYEGVMELDCAGGKYARATYGFTLPSSATKLSWKAAGSYPYSDMCCDGKVTKAGLRTSTTHYRVTVNVTGWRAYDVNYALVTYTYRYAI